MAEQRFLDLPADIRALVNVFEEDDRASAIVSLTSGGGCEALYENPAFQRLEQDSGYGVGQFVEELDCAHRNTSASYHCRVHGRLWRCKQLAVEQVALICVEDTPETAERASQKAGRHEGTRRFSPSDRGTDGGKPPDGSTHAQSWDWTRFDVPGVSPYIQLVKNHDWASTRVGPMSTWSMHLRLVVLSIMRNPSPRLIMWGEAQTFIYNEACVPLFGSKHPHFLGRPISEAFSEAWSSVSDFIRSAHDGNVVTQRHLPLTLMRSEFKEQAFFDFTLMPLIGPDGRLAGIIDELSESTRIVRAERRRHSILQISERLTSADTLKELWCQLITGLENEAAKDEVPFAMFYAVVDDVSDGVPVASEPNSHCATSKKAVLKGQMGIPSENNVAVNSFPLDYNASHSRADGIATPCIRAWHTGKSEMLSASDNTIPDCLKISNPDRADGSQVRDVMVLPVASLARKEKEVVGILVLALDPRCPYDSEFQAWVHVLTDLIERSATLISLPEQQRRAQQLADEINSALTDQLRTTSLKAEASDLRFEQMASRSPIGMFLFASDGRVLYVNDAFLETIGQTREDFTAHEDGPTSWNDMVHPDDLERFGSAWKTLVERSVPITVEYRLKRPWVSVDRVTGRQITGECWLLANAFPDISSDGKATTVQGWLTDISHRKFSDNLMSQRLEDALENKRQTENFIDMTSHEMRNPLSAILQSADSIVSNLNGAGMPILSENLTLSDEVAEEIIDAAQTIILCGQHQKRIVDDILTLSKLDASLLVISPDTVQPPKLISKAFKMYESEISRAEITTRLCVEPSYYELKVDRVVLDSSRLLQVVINLLTNAIKFTQHSETRTIVVSLGASYQQPTGRHHNVEFIPPRQKQQTPKSSSEWTEGEELYLQVAVQDSGQGLSDEEIKTLFQRFKQASPKTYKQYGGSGLGLFISRELCELQGGQIGVSSVHGKSTTFTFFVRTRRWVETSDKAKRPPLSSFTSTSASPIAYGRRGSVPLTQVNEEHDQAVNGDTKSSKTQKPSKDHGVLHVLIVEDNLINQKVMSQQLRRAGCVVHVANHGLECLDFLEKTSYCDQDTELSVVLLDLEMPTMDGLTCIRKIRERQAAGRIRGHVPVIAVTANARSEQISVAIDAGMDSVVTKPFRIPELVPKMRSLVEEIGMREGT